MRRALIGISTLSVLAASAAGALGAPSEVNKQVVRSVTLADCHPADDVTQRYASFAGRMKAVPGSARMAMHFTLLEHVDSSVFKPVSLPDLRTWRKSKPGARTWIYTQRVTALRDGGSYRMRAQFRWYDNNGAVLKTSTARSAVCRQPVPLPDLRVSSIVASPGATPDERKYSITVANDGFGEARDVDVALKVDGATVSTARVDLLPAQESTVVQVPGPVCGLMVRGIADPDSLIRETDERDNALTVPCPPTGP